MSENAQTVFLNGQFMPIEEARVPVLDRGFIFGDGVYEVVPVYRGRPFRWQQHLKRLSGSLAAIDIENPFDDTGWTDLVYELIKRHPWADQFIYIQVTRGVAKRDHAFPKGVKPTVFAMSSEFSPVPEQLRETGVRAISLPDERWFHCDIKSISLLGNVLAKQEAVQAGAFECVMFRDGYLTEGSSSNIWVVRNGKLFCPPRDRLILEGVRMSLVDELCQIVDIDLDIRRITREEVQQADELLLSSATRELLPITTLDGQPVGNGRPGPLYAKLYDAYQVAKLR
jgi:D-alanine transaminase